LVFACSARVAAFSVVSVLLKVICGAINCFVGGKQRFQLALQIVYLAVYLYQIVLQAEIQGL
jgi:hypothetical protein